MYTQLAFFFALLTFTKIASAKPTLKVYQLDLNDLSDQLSLHQDVYDLPSLNKPLYIDNKSNQKTLKSLYNYNQIEHLIKRLFQEKHLEGNPLNDEILRTLSSLQLNALRNGNAVDVEAGTVLRGGSDDNAVLVPKNRVYLISNPEAILKAKLERNRKNIRKSEETEDSSSTSDDLSTSSEAKAYRAGNDNLYRALLQKNLHRRRAGRFSKVNREDHSDRSDSGIALDDDIRGRSEDFNVMRSYRTSIPFAGGRNRNIYE